MSVRSVWDMSFLKRHWLFVVGLVVLLCVALGVFLVWNANQPVEPKRVYLMPEPNPERPEILKRALQPPKGVYTPKVSAEEKTAERKTANSLEVRTGEPSIEDSEFPDDDLESMLAELDEETAKEKGDFPAVPEGFPFTPVWLRIPDYTKGDELGSEQIARVLIKLWNQGDRAFEGGTIWHNNGQIYPIYPDVLYVQRGEWVINNEDGNPVPVRYITSSIGPFTPEFDATDLLNGEFETKYSDIEFIPLEHAGYDPHTFLTEND